MTEEATFDLTYEGLVAAHAEADDPEQPTTLRINGVDVLRALAAAAAGLCNPIGTVVTINGEDVAAGGLDVRPAWYDANACSDPDCCPGGGGYEPAELTVGTTNVLTLLNHLHGQEREVRFYGRGYVAPMVDVTLAHHTRDLGAPGDRVTLRLDAARRLRTRVTRASWDRVEATDRSEQRRRVRIRKGEEF